ncbi:MAG: mannitol dehydrogenase family protein [Pseudomonadota bacterium]
MAAIPLNRSNIGQLPEGISPPSYDPADVTPGIVHLGPGGFHRAHMARYAHDLMEMDRATLGWGITGAGLVENDRAMLTDLEAQDGLYTLVERGGGTETSTVIGSLAGLIFAADDSAALLVAIRGARIVSLTITEHGYCLDRATRTLDFGHPLIAHDLAEPGNPRSAVGILVEAYRQRMAQSAPAFSAMSCDNIQHNGAVLRGAVLALAGRLNPVLAAWIAKHARFPGTMVDRITPVTQTTDVEAFVQSHGVTDRRPIFCESFRQWVIEDDFADGRPDWDRVGAQFVADVEPYEFMKLRILNATHLAVSGPGRLIGHETIGDTMADPALRGYAEALMERETGPTLKPVPGVDLAEYKRQIIERFANPAIVDPVERVNTDAALNYLLDPIRDRLVTGESIELLAFAVAAWLRRVRGIDEQGAPIDIRHPLAAQLREKAEEGGPDPRPLLAMEALFGDLGRNRAFVEPVARHLASLYAKGAAATLAALEI